MPPKIHKASKEEKYDTWYTEYPNQNVPLENENEKDRKRKPDFEGESHNSKKSSRNSKQSRSDLHDVHSSKSKNPKAKRREIVEESSSEDSNENSYSEDSNKKSYSKKSDKDSDSGSDSSSSSSSSSSSKNQDKKSQKISRSSQKQKSKTTKENHSSNVSIKRHKGEWDEEIEIETKLDFEYVSDIEIDNEDEFYLNEDGPKYAKHLNPDFYKERESANEINIVQRFPKAIIEEDTTFQEHKWKMLNILKVPFNPENTFKEMFQTYNISDLIEGKGPQKSKIVKPQ